MSYRFARSPNKSSRRGVAINSIILHFTASATLVGTLKWFMDPVARVSAHYVIGRDGAVVQLVKEQDKAWHAGAALLEGDPRVNSMSLGIELVNWGRLKRRSNSFYCWPDDYMRAYNVKKYGKPMESTKFVDGRRTKAYWAPYPEAQLEALVVLCRQLKQKYPAITPERIVGHEDVAPGRKDDPGPALNMKWVRDQTLILPNELYYDSDEPDIDKEAIAKRQQDRAEPLSWYEKALARLHGYYI